uniref:Uncharacterized protein n=1 Tax=Quercus lobata TaxID=97700 RepID=A0A7N2LF30_QUELO
MASGFALNLMLLWQDLDFAVVVEHVVAFDHVQVVHVMEDLDFGADLAAHQVLMVPVYDLEGEDSTRRLVDHSVHGPSRAASDSIGSLELGVAEA